MELFPAQPDLSLQISLPNSKPTSSSSWRRSNSTDHEEEENMDLGFWKRALESRNRNSSLLKTTHTFDLSLSNPITPSPNNPNPIFHYPFQNSTNHNNNVNNNTTFQLPFHQNHQNSYFYHNHNQSLSQELGFLRPIRGIPVYQNPPNILPPNIAFAQRAPLDVSASASSYNINTSTTCSSTTTNFHSQANLMRSRFLSRFPSRRSMRAPRMRWTTTLHARFVHAVELLGGHESKQNKTKSFFLFSFVDYFSLLLLPLSFFLRTLFAFHFFIIMGIQSGKTRKEKKKREKMKFHPFFSN